MPFSTIAVKLQLVMPKTKKTGDQKNLLVNYIFIKVVISSCNKRDAFGTNFTS